MKHIKMFGWSVVGITMVVLFQWMITPPNIKRASNIFIKPYHIHTPTTFEVGITPQYSDRDVYVSGLFNEEEDTTTYISELDYIHLGWKLVDTLNHMHHYIYGEGKYILVSNYSEVIVGITDGESKLVVLFLGVPKNRDELYIIMRQVGIIKEIKIN